MKEKSAVYRRRVTALILAAVFVLSALAPAAPIQAKGRKIYKWGVFIGKKVSVRKCTKYDRVVIDALNFDYTKEEIRKIKKSGTKVYSYLSIGAIATYRPYYKRFKKYTMGTYNNWPEERWIDTSKKSWQRFVIRVLVRDLQKKGINRVWIDNTDVFWEFRTKKIYVGLLKMVKAIRKRKFKIIINGGDEFVTRLLETPNRKLIDGVMQEEVLTAINDYDKGIFGTQIDEDHQYYMDYLRFVRKNRKSIAIMEYTRSAKRRREIIHFCKKNGYSYYITNRVGLE